MSLWLACIRPNLSHRGAASDLRDAVGMHRTVMRLFPDDLGDHPRSTASVLFRIDQDRNGPAVLIQSALEPDPHTLEHAYGDIEVKDLTPMLAALREGRRVHYRIAANAVRRISRTPKPGRDAGATILLDGDEAEEWWRARAETAGLKVDTAECAPAEQAVGTHGATGSRVRYHRRWFAGTATVTDPASLKDNLTKGIGRGRSYGCGLLTLAPDRHAFATGGTA
jgi:CRISPR system Cascade subunit CasE